MTRGVDDLLADLAEAVDAAAELVSFGKERWDAERQERWDAERPLRLGVRPSAGSEEPDPGYRVQLDVVGRRAGHTVLLVEEAETAYIHGPVDVVPVGEADPVAAGDRVPGGRDGGLPR